MCGGARFQSWPTLTELNCIPFFNPPLKPGLDGNSDPHAPQNNNLACQPGPGQKPTIDQLRTLLKFDAKLHPTYGTKRSLRDFLRRNTPAKPLCEDGHVVISDLDAHSAKEVCESTTSVGPDFVSTVKGLYCDMCKHKLWPTCTREMPTACFDLELKSMRFDVGPKRRDIGMEGEIPWKSYDRVFHWK
jgi:hypothetical protein